MSPLDLTKRHYDRLLDQVTDGDHPVDELVARMPDVAAVDDAARALAATVEQRQPRAAEALWNEYEDLRLQQRSLHEERFFDVGFELGRVAGISEFGEALASAQTQNLVLAVRMTVVRSGVRRDLAVVSLLALARALLLGEPFSSEGASDGNA